MDTIREVFDPNFLLRNSVYISVLFGVACPLLGVYLVLRRLVFMGVALPQVSSCGIAFAFALQGFGVLPHAHDSAGEELIAFAGSMAFTLAALIVFSILARRRSGSIEARVGTAYVLAGAWSILLLVKNPTGEHGLLDLLKGEIIAVSDFQLLKTALVFVVIIALLIIFQKEFLLVSFDPEMAQTLKMNALAWDSFLFLLIGLTISICVLSVGPLVTFGFLLLPPLTAHLYARNMRQFAVLAATIGGLSALAGFCVAYRWDLPVGATDVALLGCIYAVAYVARKLISQTRAAA